MAYQDKTAPQSTALRAFEALTTPKAVTLTGRNRRASERAIESEAICMKRRVSLIRREDKRARSFSQSPIAINRSESNLRAMYNNVANPLSFPISVVKARVILRARLRDEFLPFDQFVKNCSDPFEKALW